MSSFDKKPLTYATLLPGEVHLYSAVLVRVASFRLFGFFGPKWYYSRPGAVRYRAHLTDQRLLLDLYPYSEREIYARRVTVQSQIYQANQALKDDPNARYMAIPYDRLSVTCFKRFIGLKIAGIKKEMVFIAQLDTEGRMWPKGNIIDNMKKLWKLPEELSTLCQQLIAAYLAKAS